MIPLARKVKGRRSRCSPSRAGSDRHTEWFRPCAASVARSSATRSALAPLNPAAASAAVAGSPRAARAARAAGPAPPATWAAAASRACSTCPPCRRPPDPASPGRRRCRRGKSHRQRGSGACRKSRSGSRVMTQDRLPWASSPSPCRWGAFKRPQPRSGIELDRGLPDGRAKPVLSRGASEPELSRVWRLRASLSR